MIESARFLQRGAMRKVSRTWSTVSLAMSLAAFVLVATLAAVAAPSVIGVAGANTGPGNTGSVYLVIGQSNAAGRGDLPNPLPVADGVFVLDDAGDFIPATPNLNQFSTIQRRTGEYNLGFTFGQTIHEATGEDVHLVVNARGGSNIRNWVPDGPVEPESGLQLFEESVARAQIALEETGSTLGGVVWHQGESNRNDANYLDMLELVIEGLRAEFNDPDLPFVAGELSHLRSDNDAFNSRLPGIEAFGNSSFATAEGLTTVSATDLTHFDTPALRTYGVRYAARMLELQGFNDNDIPNDEPDTPSPTPTEAGFVPEPGVTYRLTAQNGSVLAGDSDRDRDSFALSTAAAAANPNAVAWEFVDAGNGQYHLDLAIGGDFNRLSVTDNASEPLFARLTRDRFTGGDKSFAIQETSPGSGTYHITALNNRINGGNDRLFLTNNDAGFTSPNTTGSNVTFTIAEAQDTGNDDPEPQDDTPAPVPTAATFVPELGVSYTLTANNGSILAGDSGDDRDSFAVTTTQGNADAVAWNFTPREGDPGRFHIDLAAGGEFNRLSINSADPNFARLTQDRFDGDTTYFEITETSPGSGTYFVTAPDNRREAGQDRLILTNGDAGFTNPANEGNNVTFTITPAQDTGNDAPEPQDDAPAPSPVGATFVPEPGVSYTLTANNGSILAGDSGNNRDSFAVSTTQGNADATAWNFAPVNGQTGVFHLDLAVGGDFNRLSINDADPNFARLARDRFDGTTTYFEFAETSPGSNTYFVTAIDNDRVPGQDRLILTNGDAGFTNPANEGNNVTFTITPVG